MGRSMLDRSLVLCAELVSCRLKREAFGSLGQDDLVIEADDNALWHSRRIVALVCDRVDQVLAEYRERCERIGSRVKELQRQVAVTLDEISSERPAGRKPVQ